MSAAVRTARSANPQRSARFRSGNGRRDGTSGRVLPEVSGAWQHLRVRVVGVDHVQLAMPRGREQDAVAFYQDLLGIPRVAKPPALAARGGCWFESGTVKVHLGVEEDFR